ncbi:MAG: hypothetical protein P4L84_15165 [Isosphaeraceae bacterium]|nr:hypothetical protein [Isosphaeraceae bacterium]
MESSQQEEIQTATFDDLDATLRGAGAEAAIDQLVQHLEQTREYRALLDALLLKARHELGLPLVPVGPLSNLPEPARTRYEDRYVDAIRSVGSKLLASGDLPSAWSYFRAIGEPEPVSKALSEYVPESGDERLGTIIEVAFNQGANPRRGFELILENYGTCSAITAFEHLPQDETTRTACAGLLVRQLHSHLVANLRAEIAQRGQPLPPEGTPIQGLLAGRDWLFSDEAYHIDVSHLGATVRLAPILADHSIIALAVELTDYGRCLSERHRYEGEPPFERTYEDHAVYLRAVLGQDVDAAIAHFRAKIAQGDNGGPAESYAAQVLVGLLVRLNRLDEAIDVAAEHLALLPESALMCPSVAQLCQRAGQPDRLAHIAREHGDLVNYAAAILQNGVPERLPS